LTTVSGVTPRADQDPRRGFSSPLEFNMAVMQNAGIRDRAQVSDERLRPLAQFDKEDKQSGGDLAYLLPRAFNPASLRAAAGSDEQGNYADRFGGFLQPTQVMPGMLTVPFEGDPTAGLTQSVPMGAPIVKFNARTDKDHSTSVSGGFTVTRRPETVAGTASRMEMEQVELKASSLFGLAYASEELLTDSPISFAALIDSGFRDQFPAAVLNEKLNGAAARNTRA
jgi:HK97 family phage major capsid protein